MNINLSNENDLQKLRDSSAGTQLYISGKILSARDSAHKRLKDIIDSGKNIPINLKDRIIYYMGPTPARPGKVIGSCGPTSSYRMDDFLEITLKLGVIATIGKGDRAIYINDLIKKYNSPYMVTIGGAGAYLAECIVSARILLFEDLGVEAINELEVKNFPVIIGIDNNGNTIFK